MGVLEDAIREHLDLKRAHGASDEEVEREQTEAFGPTRETAPAEAEGGESLEEAEAPEPGAPEEPPAPESEVDAPPELAGDSEEPEPEHAGGDQPEDFVEHADPMPEPEPEPEPEGITFDEEEPGVAAPMPEPSRPSERSQPDTAEGDSEDVLEDTPDFLQDTPDHDRLWFEQKPPRDFDFD